MCFSQSLSVAIITGWVQLHLRCSKDNSWVGRERLFFVFFSNPTCTLCLSLPILAFNVSISYCSSGTVLGLRTNHDKRWQMTRNDYSIIIDYSILLMSSMTVLSPLFPSRFTSCGSCFCICCRCSSHFTLCVNTFWNCLYFYLYLVSQLQPLHPLWIHFDIVCICICCRSSSHFILCEDVFESLASKSLFWEIFFLGNLRKLRVIMSNKEANYDFGRGI